MEKDNTVAFTVLRRLPIGLLVRLENGEEGIIRVRETSWDPDDRRRWQELYPENWSSRAVLLGERKGGRPELSLRLASNDPWDGVPGRYRKGQTVRGVVSGVMKYGVFVDISTGVTGLLHVSELPSAARGSALDLFWPGDHLLVSILAIDLNRRRINLGLAHGRPGMVAGATPLPAAQRTGSERTGDDLLPRRDAGQGSEHLSPALLSIEQLSGLSVRRHILIVEDDDEQAATLSNWFERIGYRVDVCHRGQAGLKSAEQDPPDLAVVDLTLPDMLGAQVLREILDAHPTCRGVLITDWARADEHVQALEALQAGGVAFLLKPILPADLVEILREDAAPVAQIETQQPAPARQDRTPVKSSLQAALKLKLVTLVKDCQETLQFDVAALFALDPVQRSVELVCASSDPSAAGLINADHVAALVFSPVRNAAEDGEEVLLDALRDSDLGRFRYLLEFFPLQACCGVRVPASGARRYALFLMHCTSRSITPETLVYARGVSLAIAAELDHQMFQEHAILVQRTALLGQLTRGLVHEINHQISPLGFEMQDLLATLEEIKTGLNPSRAVKDAGAALQSVDENIASAIEQTVDLQQAVETLISTTRQFGRIITRPKEEFLRIDEPIENALKLLDEIGDFKKVSIHFQRPERWILVRSQATIIEQILINLALNAIQQIQPRPNEPGWVQVRVETHKAEDGEKIQIRVEDNGPGIHVRQWEQIFEVGYTTREDGSGMGLYISRSLVEVLGGRLLVEESYILGGSTFLLEIPANV